MAFERSDIVFDSWGLHCAAWLYRPAGADGGPATPCVVMAHGWTGVREQRLDAYAERFAAAGYAVLLFDYRNFGASEGEPRQLISIRKQLEDWAAAISFARAQPGIDPERIALWGSSFSGGHVLTTAARDRRVAAVVAQVPFIDGAKNLGFIGPRRSLLLTREGLRDAIGALLGRPPRMIASVGPPGSVAVMTAPNDEAGFRGIDPAASSWRNEAPARILLRVGSYRPGTTVGQIVCPVLYCVGEADAVTPPGPAIDAAARTPRGELRRYPIDHFEVYVGEWFERAVADQLEFLQRAVPTASDAPGARERAGRFARTEAAAGGEAQVGAAAPSP